MNLFISYRERSQPRIVREVATYSTTDEELFIAYFDLSLEVILISDIW